MRPDLDRLEAMWQQQVAFMRLLQERRSFHDFPVDLTSKAGQKVIKEVSHDCMHELFEAVTLLRNSKNHRKTEVTEFARDEFVEELCDALHFFFEVCIFAGISQDELFKAYIDKGERNVTRIMEGY